jgi:putative transposase
VPDRVVIDKSGANLTGLQAVNMSLKFTGSGGTGEIRQVKYLNNIMEQDHRFIKRITAPMMGFKAFHSATLEPNGSFRHNLVNSHRNAIFSATPYHGDYVVYR